MISRSRALCSAVLGLPLILAACQTPSATTRPGAPPPAGGYSGVGAESAGPTARPPAMGGGALPSTAELAADPMRFKGLWGTDVTGLLGAPSFQRHDGDSDIWQYYGPASTCVLDLFLYPEQGQPRVAHAELRSRGPGNANGCLAQILDGKRG